MRRLLTFDCEGAQLGASLDEADGATGILMVTGGSQTRIGSHRLYERLSKSLAEQGFPCFRFDRRGVGDSTGEDPGFKNSEADLVSAHEAFLHHAPQVENTYGIGLCDGATALALHGLAAGLSGVILINPWLVETQSDEPAPAALRSHYRQRLFDPDSWRKLLSGGVNIRKMFASLGRATVRREPSPLAEEAAFGLAIGAYPVALILATGDNTAIAAAAEVRRRSFSEVITTYAQIDTDSHTFAKPGDLEALLAAILQVIPTDAGMSW